MMMTVSRWVAFTVRAYFSFTVISPNLVKNGLFSFFFSFFLGAHTHARVVASNDCRILNASVGMIVQNRLSEQLIGLDSDNEIGSPYEPIIPHT